MKVRVAKEGWVFVLGVLVILIIAMSYMNNLAFLFSFFLLAACLLSGVLAYGQIQSLELLRAEVRPAAVGEKILVRAVLKNRNQQNPLIVFLDSAQAIAIQSVAGGGEVVATKKNSETVYIDFDSTQATELELEAKARGKYVLRSLRAATTFPLGIFQVSRPLAMEQGFFVYPRPEGDLPLPARRIGASGDGDAGIGRGDDFQGHRSHQEGEPERHVDWKVFARKGQKLIKDFRGGSDATLLFSIEELSGLDEEAKVSQLANWCETALSGNFAWALDLGTVVVAPDRGQRHFHRCMEQLALYREVL